MSDPVDALATRIERLLRERRLPRSALSPAMRERLRPLFDAGTLAEERTGAGGQVVVRDAESFARFVRREYPSGIAPTIPDETPLRARSVLVSRDAKRAKRGGPVPVHLRALGADVRLRRGEDSLDISAWTRAAGAAGLVVEPQCEWQFEGAVALVENLEVFLHVERIVGAIDLVLFAPGRLSGVVRDWLASPVMAKARYLHLGDYDPVGLDEYLKLKAVCASRVALHVPPDIEERLRRFGKESLLLDSAAVLDRLRRAADPEVSDVVRALDRYGRGLEQEALLISI
ncbi:hypothetical protein [Sorangium sp. So ce1182]|uniref:hypothetical protein n=1 Tax=Sorangium sp. So ce1182 TaxID=3133334 RepID=UPI003F5D91E7